MNLLEEKWLPIRRRTGQVDWIAPHQIAEPDIVAFAANRSDFNGALAQMMIGLMQTTTPIEDEGDWEDLLDLPPNAEVLQKWFVPIAEAFVLGGDGARFMQDFSLTAAEGAECTIDALLIDAAGGSAIDKNTDHFVKRNTIKAMCPHCAATALFTLQTNAPAGGAGHRTSLRGGGPLTTLVVATPSRSLWQDLWLNVKPQPAFLQQGGDAQKTAKHFTFPWLADINKIQPAGGETQPLQVHPHHLFWAMPRRIRLDFSNVQMGLCDVCKRDSAQLLHRYVTKPQGLNYKGAWRHPFSPYYETKEDWLPVHPQPGGFSYKNWLAWVLGVKQGKKSVQAAGMVDYFFQARAKYQASGQFRLWVFGYDMDNMKPRCWYETTFPLYGLADAERAIQGHVQDLISNRIEATEQAVFYLGNAIKEAWFPKKDGKSDARGDLSFVDKSFWDSTELSFYQQLNDLMEQARTETGIDMDDANFIISLGDTWHKVLIKCATKLFDVDIVGAGAIGQQDPRRIAEAYNSLQRNLYGDAIKTILRLPVTEKKSKPGKEGKKAKSSTEPQAQSSL
ncbi:type I-E CRISPR-associated protein Cse1/CasA [Sulfuriferula sp. AH1]|uniref:type I-E CRISPR-associated protein Cse1/CasA n=1 Tax=Sulfuriferula sp. AH1 TaxID=1985873 RepID=UPI0012F94074|nr:type I-E CRISPR-associated protein Cse1/CasA [Sulfuriferula sp. AH1]